MSGERVRISSLIDTCPPYMPARIGTSPAPKAVPASFASRLSLPSVPSPHHCAACYTVAKRPGICRALECHMALLQEQRAPPSQRGRRTMAALLVHRQWTQCGSRVQAQGVGQMGAVSERLWSKRNRCGIRADDAAQGACTSAPIIPPSDPAATAKGDQAHRPHVPTPTGLSRHPAPDAPSGATVPATPVDAVLAMTSANAVPTHVPEGSPSSTPASEQWQPVERTKRRIRSPYSCESAPEWVTRTLASHLPDRACKKPRGFYALLAALSDDDEATPFAAPTAQRGQKRRRHPDLPPVPPAAATDSPSDSVSVEQPTTQRDEASPLPHPCSNRSPVPASATANCLHNMRPQICAVATSGRREKKRNTVQVTTPLSAAPLDRLQTERQCLPSCVKRKSDSQSVLPAVRRSTQ